MKTIAISGLGGLFVGLLLGFIPEHLAKSKLHNNNASLIQSKAVVQDQLNITQNKLRLSSLALHSGEVFAQVQSNNYAVASSGASGLFTDLRKYVDENEANSSTQQIREVLDVRDRAISGLAQANPAVKPLLAQVFAKLDKVCLAANQSN